MIMIEGIIKCSKSFQMGSIDLLCHLHTCISLINNKIICTSIWKFPVVITLEEEPCTVAKPDVQFSLNV